MATSFSDITPTPAQTKDQIVFTAGASVTIDAPASVVFDVITRFSQYSEWNTWTTSLVFPEGDKDVAIGSNGTLKAEMKAQGRSYDVPLTIIELERTAEHCKLAWRSNLMPTWVARAERVQIVQPVEGNPDACTVRSWESMSGPAAYAFKYVMGVPQELNGANATYLEELKRRVEGIHR